MSWGGPLEGINRCEDADGMGFASKKPGRVFGQGSVTALAPIVHLPSSSLVASCNGLLA